MTSAPTSASTAAIAGHIFPVWTGFRGGKGVATSAGACLAVFPAYVPINFVVAMLGALGSHRAEVGTRIGCAIWVAAAVAWWAFGWSNLWGPDPTGWLVVFSVLGAGMILWAFARPRADKFSPWVIHRAGTANSRSWNCAKVWSRDRGDRLGARRPSPAARGRPGRPG